MDNQINHQLTPDQIMKHSSEITCKECGCMFFKQVVSLRRVSKLILAAPTDQVMPIPIFRCDDCGAPLQNLIDEEPEPTNDEKPTSNLKLIT